MISTKDLFCWKIKFRDFWKERYNTLLEMNQVELEF